MAYSFINSATGRSSSSADTATTDAADMTDADVLFLIVTQSNPITPDAVITDNVGGNTWTKIIRSTASGASDVTLFRCSSPSVSNSMTVTATITGQGAAFGLVLFGFSGAHASPDDQTDTNSASLVNSVDAGATGITPSENACLVIAGLSFGVGSTIDDGFTLLEIGLVPSESWGAAGAYLIQSTAAAVNPTFSWSGTNSPATVLASFKPTSPARFLILSDPA